MKIEIVNKDIREVAADVVVLKYAQAFYGADSMVAAALSRPDLRELAPRSGEFALVPSEGRLVANHALFLGVVPLFRFDYTQIRSFAKRALSVIVEKLPQATTLAMTMHGMGYGLDEREAFLAQVAGLWEAAAKAPSVRKVVIAEKNAARARRLRAILEEAERENQPPLDAGMTSQDKPHVFVAMPFSKKFDDVYVFGIQGPVNDAGLLCERVDMVTFTGDILERIKTRIQTATLVIADLSGANANVYLEVGYAWGVGRPTLLLTQDLEDLKFDVIGQQCLVYESILDLSQKLRKCLEELT